MAEAPSPDTGSRRRAPFFRSPSRSRLNKVEDDAAGGSRGKRKPSEKSKSSSTTKTTAASDVSGGTTSSGTGGRKSLLRRAKSPSPKRAPPAGAQQDDATSGGSRRRWRDANRKGSAGSSRRRNKDPDMGSGGSRRRLFGSLRRRKTPGGVSDNERDEESSDEDLGSGVRFRRGAWKSSNRVLRFRRKNETSVTQDDLVVESYDVPDLLTRIFSRDAAVDELVPTVMCAIDAAISFDPPTMVENKRALADFDFQASRKFRIRTAKPSKKLAVATDPNSYNYDYYIQDFAPLVFRRIRETFGVKTRDYLESLTQGPALSVTYTPGKSGSLFFYSQDKRFIIKTLPKTEALFLMSILKQYYEHMLTNPNTLVTRFCGLHRIQSRFRNAVYIVVMSNVFWSDVRVDERFDLKGSTVGRSASSKEKLTEDAVLKDLDFAKNRRIHLGPTQRKLLLEQLDKDTTFLRSNSIIDYSLIVGIHHGSKHKPLKEEAASKERKRSGADRSAFNMDAPPAEEGDASPALPRVSSIRRGVSDFGQNIRRKIMTRNRTISVFQLSHGGVQSDHLSRDADGNAADEIYFLGIIDILTPYGISRRAQHYAKSTIHNPDEVSTVNPQKYASRFLDFMNSIIR